MTISTAPSTEPWTFIDTEETYDSKMNSTTATNEIDIDEINRKSQLSEAAAKSGTEKQEQPEAKTEVKPEDSKTKKPNSATPKPRPTLHRQPTDGDWIPVESESDEERYIPRRGRNHPRRGASPVHQFQPIHPVPKLVPMLDSSTTLLSCVGTYDGVADLAFPGRGSIYLTTYPNSTKEVRQWSWLFNAVIGSGGFKEGEWMSIPKRASYSVLDDEDDNRNWILDEGRPNYIVDDEYDDYAYDSGRLRDRRRPNDYIRPRGGRVIRDRSPYYEPANPTEIARVLLSRALDTEVVPEDDEKAKDVRYWIVVQNRFRSTGVKLLIARSRKAAGMHLFYEMLNGHSIVFVGAVVVGAKAPRDEDGKRKKLGFRCVESLEEARTANFECDCHIGIVC